MSTTMLTCVIALMGGFIVSDTAARADEEQSAPIVGSFAVGGSLSAGIDERSGTFALQLPLFALPGISGGTDVSLSYHSARAGLDESGFGAGWGWNTSRVLSDGGVIRVATASGGLFTADESASSGLRDYPAGDLHFSQRGDLLPEREGLPSDRLSSYALEYPGGMDYFDANGNMIARRNAFGARTDWIWGPDNELTQVIDDDGVSARLTYTSTGVTVSLDPRSDGIVSTTVLQIDDRRLRSVAGPDGASVSFAHNVLGELESLVADTGARTTISYQDLPDGHRAVDTVRISDDKTGEQASLRQWKSRGVYTASGYPDYASEQELWRSGDGACRYMTELSDESTTVLSEYNSMGLLLTRNLVVSSVDGPYAAHEQSYVYPGTADGGVPSHDAVPANYGKPTTTRVTVKAPNGVERTTTEHTSFDETGRPVMHTLPDGSTTETRYDPNFPEGSHVPSGLVLEQTTTKSDGTRSRTVNTPTLDHTSIAATETFTAALDGGFIPVSRAEKTTDAHGFVTEQRVFPFADGNQDKSADPVVTRFSRHVNRHAQTVTLTTTHAAGTTAEATTHTTRDLVSGHIISVIDAMGSESTTSYDTAGRPVTQTSPRGLTMTTSYDNRVTRVTDPTGITVSHHRDVVGRTIRVTDNITVIDGNTRAVVGHERTIETRRYESNDSVVVMDGRGRETTTTSDIFGRVTEVKGPNNIRHLKRYDDVANTMTTGSVSGTETFADARYTTTTHRDTMNRDARTTSSRRDTVAVPEQNVAFDGFGRIASQTAGDITTDITYRPDGSPTTTRQTPLNTAEFPGQSITASRDFDAWGTPVEKTLTSSGDARSGVRRVVDAAGRTASETNQAGETTRYQYTSDGLVSVIDNEHEETVTKNHYDPVTRDVTLTETSRGEKIARTAFDYDPLTRALRGVYDPANEAATRMSYAYDMLGNRTATIYPDGKTLTHHYDEWGSKTSTTDIAGNTSYYEYDTTGFLSRVTGTDAAGSRTTGISYEYDTYGRTKAVHRDNGVSTRYTFTSADEIATEMTMGTGGVIFDARYAYDTHGNLAQKDVKQAGAEAVTTQYSYNAYNQLVRSVVLERLEGTSEQERQATETRYELGVSGNVTRETTISGVNTTQRDFEINDLGQTIAIMTNGERAPQHYDSAGNLVKAADGTRYTYTARNEVEAVTAPDGRTSHYGYWANGQRAQVSNGDETRGTVGFYWDGAVLANDTHTVGDVTVTASYTGGGTRLTRTLSNAPGSPQYYLSDRHGSTVALADSGGDVSTRYSYSDYGSATERSDRRPAQNEVERNPFQYAGEYTDDAGKQYLGRRVYDPESMGFTTRDDADQFNLYHYTGGNPVTRVDPTGQSANADTIVSGVFLGVDVLAALLSMATLAITRSAIANATVGIAWTAAAAEGTSALMSILNVVDQQPGHEDLLTDTQAEAMLWTGVGVGIIGLLGTGAATTIAGTIAYRNRVVGLDDAVLLYGTDGRAAAYDLTHLRGNDIGDAINNVLGRTNNDLQGVEFLFVHEWDAIFGLRYRVGVGYLTPKEMKKGDFSSQGFAPGDFVPSGEVNGSNHEALAKMMGLRVRPVPNPADDSVTNEELAHAIALRLHISGGMFSWVHTGENGATHLNAYTWSGHFASDAPEYFWASHVKQQFRDAMSERGVSMTLKDDLAFWELAFHGGSKSSGRKHKRTAASSHSGSSLSTESMY